MKDRGIKETRYINQATGEISEKKSFIDLQYVDGIGYLYRKNERTVKIFTNDDLPYKLTWTERGRVDKIRRYVCKPNNFLVKNVNREMKPLLEEDIYEILGLSKRMGKKFLERMYELNILRKVRLNNVEWYSFNPKYGLAGKRLSCIAWKIWEKELTYLPPWAVFKLREDYLTNYNMLEVL